MLPFINVSVSSEDEIFSDGITFDTINHISKIADLKVISRTSVMPYNGAGAADSRSVVAGVSRSRSMFRRVALRSEIRGLLAPDRPRVMHTALT